LDPAAGTLTFLAETSKLAVEEFIYKYGDGAKEKKGQAKKASEKGPSGAFMWIK